MAVESIITYGSSVTPKFGVKYQPFRMLTLRGTYGRGFRAPNAAEAAQSGSLFSGAPFNDATLWVVLTFEHPGATAAAS